MGEQRGMVLIVFYGLTSRAVGRSIKNKKKWTKSRFPYLHVPLTVLATLGTF